MSTLNFSIANNVKLSNVQSSIFSQLSRIFANGTIYVDGFTYYIILTTNENIYATAIPPVDAYGTDGEYCLYLPTNTIYKRINGIWQVLESLQYIVPVLNAVANTGSGVGTQSPGVIYSNIGNINDGFSDISSGGIVVYVNNNIRYLFNKGVVAIPFPEDDMILSLYNLSSPSEVIPLNATTPTTSVLTNLLSINSQGPGPFRVEVYNNSAELAYLAFGQAAQVALQITTAYILNPGEKRVFIVLKGYTSISAQLGTPTSTQATIDSSLGELRVTVLY